jgi:DNA-directed RNA polymerase II subunit RPB11
LKDKHVLFSGYQMPHPLEHYVKLKIQTDSTTTPSETLHTSINALITELMLLRENWDVRYHHLDFIF